ncbi:MAG TPA: carboxypeptidase regulatory-like domain-containing protein [Vicinamibacterales bacterium]|nr:carboxypeptidase regulatory-like domain-containing protein [Vicinamibacterales bacterium]
MFRKTLNFIVWLLVVAALPASAQTTTGGMTGVVRDAGGGVLPGVTVAATHEATNAVTTAVTNDVGIYVLRGLPVGRYHVVAALTGFQGAKNTDVVVRVNEDVRLDIALSVGAVTDTVTVSGKASTVDTTTGTLKTIVDQERIENLPLNGRNAAQLMTLVAGVLPDRTDLTSGATYPGVQPVSSSGARGNTTNYVLDGGSNNDHYTNGPNPMPNPDALQEFSVQTNSFSAEYGRNVGAIVNAVTRAGTNQFHGLGFGYFRHYKFNANNFFNPGIDDGLKRSQYGATFGGPIVRNRTFFFGSYQGTNQRRKPTTRSGLVPSAAMRNGDFSAIARPLRNPFTGEPFPNNQIPTSLFSPAAVKIANDWLPLPNPAGSDSPLTLRFAQPQDDDDTQWLGRADHTFTDKHRMYGRFWVSRASTPAVLLDGNILSSAFGRTWQNTVGSINDTYIISPSVLNNLVVTFNRTNNTNSQIYPPDYSTLGINAYNDKTPQWFFNVAGYFGINSGDTNTFLRNEIQFLDTVRVTKGRHELATGIDYSYGQGDTVNNFRANGRFSFSNAAGYTGDALADFYLGRFSTFEQAIGEYKNTRMHSLATFIQDTYRVNRQLTLNLGLRWDPFFPYTDVNDRLGCYRPGEKSQVYVNAPVGVVYPGDAACPKGGYDPSWADLGPRIGLAYDPIGDGKSSIRAGYGMFYDRPNTIATNSPANQAPFGTLVSFPGDSVNSMSNPYAGRTNPFPADPFDVPSDVQFFLPNAAFSYDPNLKNGRLQSWNLTLEREIMPSYLVRAAYAGSWGDRLAIGRELNPAIYAPGATTATTNQRRPLFPNFSTITTLESTGRSEYHSLQLTLDKRMSRGFSVLGSYTLSKTLDHASEAKQTGPTQTNPFDLEYDWGYANSDRRHRLVTSFLWQIPGTFGSGVANAVLSRWSLTGILALQSGNGITVLSGVDNARTGTGNQRADQNGDPVLSSDRPTSEKILQWFNTSVYSANALGTFGNSARNTLRGPGSRNVDLGLHKTFATGGGTRVQVRIEAFNAFNWVNLNPPNTSQNSANFGRITGAASPRVMQGALRFSF